MNKFLYKGILALILLFTATPTFAAISLVQTNSGNGDNGTGGADYVNSYTVAAGANNVTAGNMLIACITAGSQDSPVISDNAGNTWGRIASSTNLTAGRKTDLWFAQNVAGASTTLTVQFEPSKFADSAIIIREYSGLLTSGALDKIASSSSSGTTHTTATATTTAQASELLIGCGGSAGIASPTFGAGAGYGNLIEKKGSDAFTYCAMEDRIVSATGEYNASFTTGTSADAETIMATFRAVVTAVAAKALWLFSDF